MRHGGKNIVTRDIDFSKIRHVTKGKIIDSDMQHCHFLKSICDIGDPHQGPHLGIKPIW